MGGFANPSLKKKKKLFSVKVNQFLMLNSVTKSEIFMSRANNKVKNLIKIRTIRLILVGVNLY